MSTRASAGTTALVSHRVQLEKRILLWVPSCWSPKLSTKNYNQPESRELFYLVGMFRTLSLGDSISVPLRKLLTGHRLFILRNLYFMIQLKKQYS